MKGGRTAGKYKATEEIPLSGIQTYRWKVVHEKSRDYETFYKVNEVLGETDEIIEENQEILITKDFPTGKHIRHTFRDAIKKFQFNFPEPHEHENSYKLFLHGSDDFLRNDKVNHEMFEDCVWFYLKRNDERREDIMSRLKPTGIIHKVQNLF